MAEIYVKKENGDLKHIAEVEGGDDNPALVIDMLLDENARIKDREFRIIGGSGAVDVTVEGDEPINPRRDISVAPVGNGAAPASTRPSQSRSAKRSSSRSSSKSRSRSSAGKSGSKRGSANGKSSSAGTAKKSSAAKKGSATAKKAPAKKAAAKKGGGSPFKNKPGGDD